jgi:hypothetical protein
MIYTFSMLATLAGMGEGRQGYTGTPSITCSNTTPLPQTPRPHVCDACWPRQAAALAPTPHQHDNHHMGTAHRLSPPPPPPGACCPHTNTHTWCSSCLLATPGGRTSANPPHHQDTHQVGITQAFSPPHTHTTTTHTTAPPPPWCTSPPPLKGGALPYDTPGVHRAC